MKKLKAQRKKTTDSGRRAAALSFIAFGFIALAIVVALEFLDHKAGKHSFIFSQVIRLGRQGEAGQRFQSDLAALLAGRGIAHDFVRDRDGIAHLKVDLAEPLFAPLSRDLRQLVERHGGVHLLSEVQGMKEQVVYLYQVRFAGRLTHVVLISKRMLAPAAAPPAAKTKPLLKTVRPRLAIVIDDIGYADLVSDRLHELGIPVTGAVIPAAPFARSEARRLHELGLEEIIHLPMQPKDPANHHPRDQFVLTDSSAAEIGALLDAAMAAIPFARGLNNHMGSRLTSDPQAARRLLEQVKERGLFFVDSKTAPTTVAFSLARQLGMKTVLRDVFLDDVQTYEHTFAQIRRLVDLARQNGKALAIGHPFPSTLAALRDAVPWLKRQKVEIVPVSQILE